MSSTVKQPKEVLYEDNWNVAVQARLNLPEPHHDTTFSNPPVVPTDL